MQNERASARGSGVGVIEESGRLRGRECAEDSYIHQLKTLAAAYHEHVVLLWIDLAIKRRQSMRTVL